MKESARDIALEKGKEAGVFGDGCEPREWIIEAMEKFADQEKPRWIPVSERLPEIDTSDEWKNKQSHSRTIPVIESGELNLGWYNHQFGDWQVNGRIGNIRVTEWFELPVKP